MIQFTHQCGDNVEATPIILTTFDNLTTIGLSRVCICAYSIRIASLSAQVFMVENTHGNRGSDPRIPTNNTKYAGFSWFKQPAKHRVERKIV